MILNRKKFCCIGVAMRKNQGFTLIELMVTIAVFAIIVMMAAPSFGNMVTKQKLNRDTRALVSAFNLAKSQASVLKRSVAVCPNKTLADGDYTREQCAEDTIPSYALLSPADKTDAVDNRVILVALDKKVTLGASSVTKVLFNEVGSVGTAQQISLCANKELRVVYQKVC